QIEQVLPVKGQRLVEAGLDVPEQVDVTHENQEGGQLHQRTCIPLKWPRKQEQERNRKMEDDQAESDDLPAGVQSPREEADFHRQVSRPDDQQLRKAEVGPQQNKSEHQLAVIVDLFRLHQE